MCCVLIVLRDHGLKHVLQQLGSLGVIYTQYRTLLAFAIYVV